MQRWKAFNDFTQCKNVNLEGEYAKTCFPVKSDCSKDKPETADNLVLDSDFFWGNTQ